MARVQGRVFRQIIPRAKAELYAANRVTGGFSYTSVQGFLTLAQDTVAVTDPARLWAMVRADHPGISGQPMQPEADGSIFFLDFELDDDANAAVTPATSGEEGVLEEDRFLPPWTGLGSTAWTPEWIRELVTIYPLRMRPGATLTLLTADGASTLLRTLEMDRTGQLGWVRDGAPAVFPDDNLPLHSLFVDSQGLVPAHRYGEELMVFDRDRRALRLRLGALSAYGVVHPGLVWGALSAFVLPRVWLLTVGRFGGLPVTVQYHYRASDQELVAGITYVGRPWPGMTESGFWGDQYTGFHAEVPDRLLEKVDSLTINAPADLSVASESLPPRPPAAAIDELWGSDYVVLPGGAQVAVLRQGDGALTRWAPDRRAATAMFPGHGDMMEVDPFGVLVDVAPLSGTPVRAITRAHVGGSEVEIIGQRGDDLLCRPLGSDQSVTYTVQAPAVEGMEDLFIADTPPSR